MDKKRHFLFYAETVPDGRVVLDEDETRHARSVLRLNAGDEISATDGKGHVFLCRLNGLAGKRMEASVLETRHVPAPLPPIRMMVGLPEKNAFEEALKGLAALGIDEVVPVVCRFCQKKWWVRKWERCERRFRNTIMAASKQSLNPHFMNLCPPVTFDNAISSIESADGPLFFADENGETLAAHHGHSDGRDRPVTCLVGPPGGLAAQEISALRQRRGVPLRLAAHRLRTELAALMAAGCLIQGFRLSRF